MTISHEYAEELGRQIDELEAENERLREAVEELRRDAKKLARELQQGLPKRNAAEQLEAMSAAADRAFAAKPLAALEDRAHDFEEAGFDTCRFCGERKSHKDHLQNERLRARLSARAGGLTPDLMNATTVSCTGLEITIACNDHDTKDALLDVLVDAAYTSDQPHNALAMTDDQLFDIAVKAWESQTSHEWYTDALEAVISAVRDALASH